MNLRSFFAPGRKQLGCVISYNDNGKVNMFHFSICSAKIGLIHGRCLQRCLQQQIALSAIAECSEMRYLMAGPPSLKIESELLIWCSTGARMVPELGPLNRCSNVTGAGSPRSKFIWCSTVARMLLEFTRLGGAQMTLQCSWKQRLETHIKGCDLHISLSLLDSGREHPLRKMSTSENGHCCSLPGSTKRVSGSTPCSPKPLDASWLVEEIAPGVSDSVGRPSKYVGEPFDPLERAAKPNPQLESPVAE
eukprot:gene13773-biopygen3733